MSQVNKNLMKQLGFNVLIILAAVFIFRTVSYAAEDDPTVDNKNLLIQTGNMQVVLSTPNEKYEFTDLSKMNVSDFEGMKQKGYNFTVKNTGNIPIEYYEIRLVNQENKISTLPHKYLRFTVSNENGDYTIPRNLGDVDSIIYSGYNLDVGASKKLNFKMWLDNGNIDIFNKELYSALEITLYQKFDVYDNYVLYDGDGGDNIPVRTSINDAISSIIPEKEGYEFLGWGSNGEVKYHSGDSYSEKRGQTLYAIWQKQIVS